MARVLILLVLWLLHAVLILLLVNAEWLDAQVHGERGLLKAELGVERYAGLESRAKRTYERNLVDSGVIARTQVALLPQPEVAQGGMENLAPWFFKWLATRLRVLWQLAFQALIRIELMETWCSVAFLGLVCAGVDGLVCRQVRRAQAEAPSADRYLTARNALPFLLVAPLFYLCFPIGVSGYVVPSWGGAVAITLWLLTSHAQHHI